MSAACILNSGCAAWAFEPLAVELAQALGLPVAEKPHNHNYLLACDDLTEVASSFIPLRAIEIAADKRRIAEVFSQASVPCPQTILFDTASEVLQHVTASNGEWCLKYPTSCGGAGHVLLTADAKVPTEWPRPYVVQRFIRMDQPRVYRTYVAGDSIFGWTTRKFPPGKPPSPWVAHARGARYEVEWTPPAQAAKAAMSAFKATELFGSFGCADLLQDADGQWLVLEVGTDGLANHVDRDVGDSDFITGLHRRIASAFQQYASQ